MVNQMNRARSPGGTTRMHRPPHVVDTPTTWAVYFDCAGLPMKAIHVSIHRRVIIVQARAHEKFATSTNTKVEAEQCMRFYQCVTIPRNVDQSSVNQSYANCPTGIMVVVKGKKLPGKRGKTPARKPGYKPGHKSPGHSASPNSRSPGRKGKKSPARLSPGH